MADEIARLLIEGATVRDRETGVRRAVAPGDIGILFRTREGHALFEDALARRRVPFYVYKGLGFFDADEVKDVLALVGYLADPGSNLARRGVPAIALRPPVGRGAQAAGAGLAAALTGELAGRRRRCRSRRSRSAGAGARQRGGVACAGRPAAAGGAARSRAGGVGLRGGDRRARLRAGAREPEEGPRLVRRIQNRGYATLGRLVDYFAELVAGGDESNAIVDAVDAVNLMTVHAAKGLEFPIVFVVNIGKGSGGGRDDIRVVAAPFGDEDERRGGEPSVSVERSRNDSDRDSEDTRARRNQAAALCRAHARARSRCIWPAPVRAASWSFSGARWAASCRRLWPRWPRRRTWP